MSIASRSACITGLFIGTYVVYILITFEGILTFSSSNCEHVIPNTYFMVFKLSVSIGLCFQSEYSRIMERLGFSHLNGVKPNKRVVKCSWVKFK
jgi:hypothetical protein